MSAEDPGDFLATMFWRNRCINNSGDEYYTSCARLYRFYEICANACWHHTMIGFHATPRASSARAFTPSTTPSTRSLLAGSGSPTGSSKYMTLMTRR